MKRYGYGLCVVISFGHIGSYMLADQEADNKEAVQLISHVQRRYYLIRRLEKPMHKFFSVHHQMEEAFEEGQRSRVDVSVIKLFKHPAVIAPLYEAAMHGSIDPLCGLWQDFLSYKFVEDSSFVREVVTAMLLFYKNLLKQVLGKQADSIPMLQRSDAYIANRALELPSQSVDLVADELGKLASGYSYPTSRSKFHTKLTQVLTVSHQPAEISHEKEKESEELPASFNTIVNLLEHPQESTDFVVTNAMRFYHTQRLLKSIFLLSHLSEIDPGHAYQIVKHLIDNGLEQLPFKHEEIKRIVLKIKERCSLKPLFKLWQRFTDYEFIDDQLVLDEYMNLLVITYNLSSTMIKKRSDVDVELPSVNEVLDLYNQIATLSTAELLDLLDNVVDKFEQVSQQYELNNPNLSWNAWLKKYWWVPPTAIGTLVLMGDQFAAMLERYELVSSKLSWRSWLKKYWWLPPALVSSYVFAVLRHLKKNQKEEEKS